MLHSKSLKRLIIDLTSLWIPYFFYGVAILQRENMTPTDFVASRYRTEYNNFSAYLANVSPTNQYIITEILTHPHSDWNDFFSSHFC